MFNVDLSNFKFRLTQYGVSIQFQASLSLQTFLGTALGYKRNNMQFCLGEMSQVGKTIIYHICLSEIQ